jgi:hypothetical protein
MAGLRGVGVSCSVALFLQDEPSAPSLRATARPTAETNPISSSRFRPYPHRTSTSYLMLARLKDGMYVTPYVSSPNKLLA